jgi:hypothetical protein
MNVKEPTSCDEEKADTEVIPSKGKDKWFGVAIFVGNFLVAAIVVGYLLFHKVIVENDGKGVALANGIFILIFFAGTTVSIYYLLKKKHRGGNSEEQKEDKKNEFKWIVFVLGLAAGLGTLGLVIFPLLGFSPYCCY